jgi:hypothetical protein
MEEASETLETLERQIQKLQRSQERLRLVIGALACAGVVLAFTGGSQDGARVLRARSVEIVDSTGKTIAEISGRTFFSTALAEPGVDQRLLLTLRDPNNKPLSVAELGTEFARSDEGNSPFLRLRDASGAVTAVLRGGFRARPAQ